MVTSADFCDVSTFPMAHPMLPRGCQAASTVPEDVAIDSHKWWASSPAHHGPVVSGSSETQVAILPFTISNNETGYLPPLRPRWPGVCISPVLGGSGMWKSGPGQSPGALASSFGLHSCCVALLDVQ